MKKIYTIIFTLVLVSSLQAEKLTGIVTDAFTREPLIGVSIMNMADSTGTVTDLDGMFELQVKKAPVKLQFSDREQDAEDYSCQDVYHGDAGR